MAEPPGPVSPAGGIHGEFRELAANSFLQDDIKMSPRFTLNLGLRWEYNGLLYSHTGELTNVWPSLIKQCLYLGRTPATGTLAGFVVPSNYNPAINPAPPVGGLFQNNQKIGTQNNEPIDNFAPRVGFAWQPTNSDRLVLRSGFGFFYDRLTDGNYPTVYYISNPYAVLLSRSGQANYYSTFAQPYPPTALGMAASLGELRCRDELEPLRVPPGGELFDALGV